ncbi:hypothetical protein [Nonomuraea turkmeniaca]|nr:hypothetical protein [Nonomuraea turkmeniaca]
MVLVDVDARMPVAYVMNQMTDERALGIVLAAYDGLPTSSGQRAAS